MAVAVRAKLRERQAGVPRDGDVRLGDGTARDVDLLVRAHDQLLESLRRREALVGRRVHERDAGQLAVDLVHVFGDRLAQVRADDDSVAADDGLHVLVLQACLRESR